MLRLAIGASALLAAGIVLLIFLFLAVASFPALREVGWRRFLGDASWHPASGAFGLWPMIAGTLLVTAGSLALSLPAGIAVGLYLQFWAPRRLAGPVRALVELLAGIPSVVYGLWGLTVLVPAIARLSPPGPSLLAGVLILSLMTLPTIALVADAALGAARREHIAAAVALGLSRRATVMRVMLPAARRGLLTGAILTSGRALGETMAVLMVCGNALRIPKSLFDPVRTLTAGIALEIGYATDLHRSALFVCGLLLLLVVAALTLAAHVFRGGAGRAR